MTSKSSFDRSAFVRKPRSSRSTSPPKKTKPAASSRRAYDARTMYLPTEPRPRREPQPVRKTKQGRGSARSQGYDISFSLGRTDVRAPALSLPRINLDSPRLVSGVVTIALTVILVLLWTASTFTVSEMEVSGNERLGVTEISSMAGILGEPIFKAVPAQIAINLRSAYPDLSKVNVRAILPNRILVDVVERTPVIAWYQSGAITWIDAEGMAFKPHGEVTGLVQVSANGSPTNVAYDATLPFYEQQFINPDMVQAIIALVPSVPEGMLLIYDPKYGIGWQDPRGWDVLFGQNTQDLPMKLTIYQALVDRFINQGIQPTLISMEYLDAPFYK
jgi:cell division protein FtsQ